MRILKDYSVFSNIYLGSCCRRSLFSQKSYPAFAITEYENIPVSF